MARVFIVSKTALVEISMGRRQVQSLRAWKHRDTFREEGFRWSHPQE